MINDKISVMVVTFNSASTITETLDSILQQTYGSENIELIISDDASKDNTVEVINKWIESYSVNFHNVKIITHSNNQGVSKNCNDGWKHCTSEWIKSIGGDDLLVSDCIESNAAYVSKNDDCAIVFSQMQWFGRINKITPEPYNMDFFELTASEQYDYLRFKSFNIAPTSFIKRKVLIDIGYADETFNLIEDLPLWLRFTSKNYKLHFIPKVTVRYRIQDSISKHSSRYVNLLFLSELIGIDSKFSICDVKGIYAKALKFDMLTLHHGKLIIARFTGNKVGWLSRFLDVIHFSLRPIYIVRKIKRSYINRFYKSS